MSYKAWRNHLPALYGRLWFPHCQERSHGLPRGSPEVLGFLVLIPHEERVGVWQDLLCTNGGWLLVLDFLSSGCLLQLSNDGNYSCLSF